MKKIEAPVNILHICAGWQKWNGAANIARMIMDEQRREGHEVSFATWAKVRELRAADEVWIHCGWLPCLWWAAVVCFLTRIPRAKRVAEGDALAGVRRRGAECAERILKWMPEACYDPVRLRYHGWKKWLVGPIERWCLRRCDRIVATCAAEKGWIEAYLGKRCPAVDVMDVKRFFKLEREFGSDGKIEAWRRGFQPRQLGDLAANSEATLTRQDAASPKEGADGAKLLTRLEAASPNEGADGAQLLTRQDAASPKGERDSLHILYLGRRHPLKGVEYLEKAVRQLNSNPVQNSSTRLTSSALSASQRLCVRFVSNAFGEELERVWDWCDVLVLPTLSDNFGLVIAEALERGKRVITTDGAPAWGEGLELRVGSGGVEELRVGSEIWAGYGGRLIYLKGYRDGTDEERVELLKRAIERICK